MEKQPTAVFANRLNRLVELSSVERAAIDRISYKTTTLKPGLLLVKEENPPRTCALLLDGFAIRTKFSSDGARQIIAIQLPGDALDLQQLYLEEADHNVEPLTTVTIADMLRSDIQHVAEQHPNVMRAILIENQIEASISREWLLNIGRRGAKQRLAHMICEVATRLSDPSSDDRHGFYLPMTQDQLGDATGLTPVHVNRMLMELEREGSISRIKRHIHIHDWQRLVLTGDFSETYLHRDQIRKDS
jgi:CRP-like cAMP-binding protein